MAEFAKRAVIVAGIALVTAALATFAWTVSQAVLVLFTAILFAVMLDGLVRLLRRGIPLPRGLALLAVIVVLAACAGGIFVFGGMRIVNQAPELKRSMQQSVQRLDHNLRHMGVTPKKLGEMTGSSAKPGSGSSSSGAKSNLPKIFTHLHKYLSASFTMAADLFIIIIVGIYFAASPRFYIEVPIKLVAKRHRQRLRVVARVVGHGLRRWLVGRFASMVAVGLVTGIGLTLLHVQLAALLAIIAFLLTVIPYLGTIISLIPAVLVAFLNGPVSVIYVLVLYLFAHVVEGYVLTPLIQERTVNVPPGWLILSQLVGGLAAGIFGILIAAPALVTISIVVQLLYVEDVLGDQTHVLGTISPTERSPED